MEKIQIHRDSYRSSLLKEVIIRADFDSLTDLDGLVKALKKEPFIFDNFAGYRIIKSNTVNLRMPVSVVDERFLPVEKYDVENVHRFFSCKILPEQDVNLDIASSFVCIKIDCDENYDCIDGYLDVAERLILFIQEYDSFVKFNRIAIRKIDGEVFDNLETGYNVFERNRFRHEEHIDGILRDTSKYVSTECFVVNSPLVKCNLSRAVEAGRNPESFRFILDIDAYVDVEIYDFENRLTKGSASEILRDMLNNTLFLIFKTYVTKEFLNRGVVKK